MRVIGFDEPGGPRSYARSTSPNRPSAPGRCESGYAPRPWVRGRIVLEF